MDTGTNVGLKLSPTTESSSPSTSSASFHTERKRKRTANQEELNDMNPLRLANKSKIFVAVHLGAGDHSLKKKDSYNAVCKLACNKALCLLRNGASADDAVVAATMILESSGCVNAGRGSNLTLEKTVECDAGFMNGDGLFGGVGAVSGIPNPILIAKKLADLQGENNLSCGRVPPNFMVGPGAKAWAESHGISTCKDEIMISKKAAKTYSHFMTRIEDQEAYLNASDHNVSDTVGAIALDRTGKVAATVSSGGNWLKFPGRIGHSPQFGSGCWASNLSQDQNIHSAVAVSTTGVGEMLSKAHLASEVCHALRDEAFGSSVEAISQAIRVKYLDAQLLKHHTESKIVGVIALIWDGLAGEFVYGHTSRTLIVGYGGTDFKTIRMEFSTLPKASKVGETLKVEAIRL